MANLLQVQLIATQVCKGDGTEASPNRSVEQWWSTAGYLLLEYDPHEDKTSMQMNFVDFLRRQVSGERQNDRN